MKLTVGRIVQHRVESLARVSMRLQKYSDKGFQPTEAFVLPPEVTVEKPKYQHINPAKMPEF